MKSDCQGSRRQERSPIRRWGGEPGPVPGRGNKSRGLRVGHSGRVVITVLTKQNL